MPVINATALKRGNTAGSLIRLRGTPPTNFVGIDIALPSVRIAVLEPTGDDRWHHKCPMRSLRLRSTHRIDLPFDGYAVLTPERVTQMVDTLHDQLPRCVDGEHNATVLSLPQSWIHYETRKCEALSESQRSCDAIFQASAFRSRAHLSHWAIAECSEHHVVAATSEATACAIAEVLSRLGYRVDSIVPHGVALIDAMQPMTTLAAGSIVVLSRVEGIIAVVSGERCGITRSLPNCPRELQFSHDIDVLVPWVDVVADEIDATFRYASRHGTNDPKGSVVMICGDLASVDGIDEVLANRLRRPVARWCFAHRAAFGRASLDSEDREPDDAGNAIALSLAYAAASSAGGGVS
jgi:hypothetical protein